MKYHTKNVIRFKLRKAASTFDGSRTISLPVKFPSYIDPTTKRIVYREFSLFLEKHVVNTWFQELEAVLRSNFWTIQNVLFSATNMRQLEYTLKHIKHNLVDQNEVFLIFLLRALQDLTISHKTLDVKSKEFDALFEACQELMRILGYCLYGACLYGSKRQRDMVFNIIEDEPFYYDIESMAFNFIDMSKNDD